MGQSRTANASRIFALLALLVFLSCDRAAPPAPAASATVKIASLSPAATDLLLAMNAGQRLVAVSNFDGDRTETKDLPRVGDYQNIDWEKLAGLKPSVMVVQGRPDRMPPGLEPRAKELGIAVVNIQIDTIADIYDAAGTLADAMKDSRAAEALVDSIQSKLNAVRRRAKDKPKVRTLIVIGPTAEHVAGHGTFLSDLLEIAGGENVMPKESGPWPSIDRELLAKLQPQAILQMLPAASPQVLDKAKSTWPSLADVPAVKDGRIYPITDWFVNQPGARVGDTAKLFADKLHP